jgi:hypothetical protein
MFIESFAFKRPFMEIIYFSESDANSTLLLAPFDLANNWFNNSYDTTLVVELLDPGQGDISQYYLPQTPDAWLDGLPQQRRNAILQRFVNYCQNISLTSSQPITFSH